MSECNNLYVISFLVGGESGLAMVAAPDERVAFEILKNSGSRSCAEPGYILVQIRNLGTSTSCGFGLLMESYVNALVAYDAIVSVADHFIKGDKGDSIWSEAYIDSEMYLHILESELTLTPMLNYDPTTGYLTLY